MTLMVCIVQLLSGLVVQFFHKAEVSVFPGFGFLYPVSQESDAQMHIIITVTELIVLIATLTAIWLA